jgi:hypothetical protein
VVYTEHKRRDFDGTSYRIAKGSVQGTADMQIATGTGTFMRIIDNSSSHGRPEYWSDMIDMCSDPVPR